MKKPRVGFLIPRLGITDRGAEVFVYELAKRLQEGFDVIVWVRKFDKSSELLTELEKKGVAVKKIFCIPKENALVQALYAVPFLRKFIIKFHISPTEIEMLSFSVSCLPQLLLEKVDLLFPANGIWGSVVCRFIRFIKGTPFAYATLGGIEPISIMQKPDLYIAIFPTIATFLKTNYPKLKTIFIPTGVDLEKFNQKGEVVTIDLPRPLFLTVSALVPEKQVELTIQAVAKSKKGSLLVVGEGPLKSNLVRLANETLGKGRSQFIQAGYGDLPKYYRSANVFAFSAPWEVGWSIVFLEALASGLPVVANREKNLEYLLGKDWPLLCSVRNADDYSKALIKATKVKVKSRELVKDYDWDKIVEKYRKAIFLVINSKKINNEY